MYSTEISHAKLKSRLAVLSSPFFMSIGVLLVYFLGYMTGVRKDLKNVFFYILQQFF
jgi:hypothetical protein